MLTLVASVHLQAATVTYSNEGNFQAALDSGFTLIDTSSYANGTPVATISTLIPWATFFGAPSTIST